MSGRRARAVSIIGECAWCASPATERDEDGDPQCIACASARAGARDYQLRVALVQMFEPYRTRTLGSATTVRCRS